MFGFKAALVAAVALCQLTIADGHEDEHHEEDCVFEISQKGPSWEGESDDYDYESNVTQLKELLAESNALEVLGIRYCINEQGLFNNLTMIIGGPELDEAVALNTIGYQGGMCEEVLVEGRFSQKVQEVKFNYNDGRL